MIIAMTERIDEIHGSDNVSGEAGDIVLIKLMKMPK